jgi:membrane-associated phospholipid phosphatase
MTTMKTVKRKKLRMGLIALLVTMTLPFLSYSQQPDTLIRKLDSLAQKSDSVKPNNTAPSAYNETTKINVPTYFILLGSNFKQAFTKPFHMKGRDWKYLGIGVGVVTALSFADQPVQQAALQLRNGNSGLRTVSKYVTNFGGPYEFYTLGALGAYGFIFKNQKMKTTTLLATQAYITGAAVEGLLKTITGRTRPSFYGPNETAKPTFKGPFAKSVDYTGAKTNSSFPSGHTTVAFAAATVYAMEYKDKPLVPILCYTSASLIGLSRITENKHWLTDVVVGAALGYLTGRQVVNNYHRYAAVKNAKAKNGDLSFNLQYSQGVVMPGLVYRF